MGGTDPNDDLEQAKSQPEPRASEALEAVLLAWESVAPHDAPPNETRQRQGSGRGAARADPLQQQPHEREQHRHELAMYQPLPQPTAVPASHHHHHHHHSQHLPAGVRSGPSSVFAAVNASRHVGPRAAAEPPPGHQAAAGNAQQRVLHRQATSMATAAGRAAVRRYASAMHLTGGGSREARAAGFGASGTAATAAALLLQRPAPPAGTATLAAPELAAALRVVAAHFGLPLPPGPPGAQPAAAARAAGGRGASQAHDHTHQAGEEEEEEKLLLWDFANAAVCRYGQALPAVGELLREQRARLHGQAEAAVAGIVSGVAAGVEELGAQVRASEHGRAGPLATHGMACTAGGVLACPLRVFVPPAHRSTHIKLVGVPHGA